jgi:hypothetical protein
MVLSLDKVALLLKNSGLLLGEVVLLLNSEVLSLSKVVMLLEKIAIVLKSSSLSLNEVLVFLNSALLLQSESVMLLKSTVLTLDEMSLLLKHLTLLFEVHAKRPSGIGNALFNSVLNHRAHVIVDVDKVLLGGTSDHGVGSMIVALLILNGLKVVVDTTSGFLLALTFLRGGTLLDTQGNLLPEMNVGRGSMV